MSRNEYTDKEVKVIINQLKKLVDDFEREGINRTDQAKKLGLSRTHLPGLLNGAHRPGIKTVRRIAKYTGKDYEWFLKKDISADNNKGDLSMSDIDQIINEYPSFRFLVLALKYQDNQRALRELTELSNEINSSSNFQRRAAVKSSPK